MSSYLLVSTISLTLSILQCNRPAAMNLESSLRERKKRLLNNTPPRKYRPTSIGCAVTKHHGHLLLKYMQYVFIRCLIHSHLVKAWTQNKHHHSYNPNTSCLSIFFSSQNLTLQLSESHHLAQLFKPRGSTRVSNPSRIHPDVKTANSLKESPSSPKRLICFALSASVPHDTADIIINK